MTCGRYHRVCAEEEAARHWIERVPQRIRVTDKTGKAAPIGKVYFCVPAVDYGIPECDGEADRRVVDLIVVRIVIHEPPEIVGFQLDLIKKGLGQANLVIISL